MGESKQPLFAYIDESGNTGKNIFDKAQPDFFTAAVVVKGDFDARWGPRVSAIAQRLGNSAIHANELGIGRLEAVAGDLVDILIEADAHVFVSRVEKRYLLAAKMFDVFFDSGENAGVAWHHYNIRPLKLTLAFKLAYVVDEEVARDFWDFMLISRKAEATKRIPGICEKLKARLKAIPDARSRQILGEGLDWVKTHPECVGVVAIEQKAAKQGHFPNLVGFMGLLRGLDQFARERKKKFSTIVHDETNEFQAMLAYWHGLHANASAEPINHAGETWSVQLNPGSQFKICKDGDSPGIQMADTALWLYGQSIKGKSLPTDCARFLRFVIQRGYLNDFSFAGVEKGLMAQWGEILATPVEPAQWQDGQKLISDWECARKKAMANHQK